MSKTITAKSERANDGDDDVDGHQTQGHSTTISSSTSTKIDCKIIMRKPINISTLWKADGDLELNVNFVSPLPPLALFLFSWFCGRSDLFRNFFGVHVCIDFIVWPFFSQKISVRHKLLPSSAKRMYLDFH